MTNGPSNSDSERNVVQRQQGSRFVAHTISLYLLSMVAYVPHTFATPWTILISTNTRSLIQQREAVHSIDFPLWTLQNIPQRS